MINKTIPIDWAVTLVKTKASVEENTSIKYRLYCKYQDVHFYSYVIKYMKGLDYYAPNRDPGEFTEDNLEGFIDSYKILHYFLRELNYLYDNKVSITDFVSTVKETFNTVMVYKYNIGCYAPKLEGFNSND